MKRMESRAGWSACRPRTPDVVSTSRWIEGSSRASSSDSRRSERNLPEHLLPKRQDEREAIVSLHPADRNADELTFAIQYAAARHAGMAIGEARHQVIR